MNRLAGWHALEPIAPPTLVTALALDGTSLYAAGPGGVARLMQGGAWQPCVAGLHLSAVTALACAPGGPLLAGGPEGLLRSGDGGLSWRRATLREGGAHITAITLSPQFAHDGVALAATLADGVLRSADGGQTWEQASFGLSGLDVLGLAWLGQELVLAATVDGIYRSPNAGRAWRVCPDSAGLAVAALAALPAGLALAALEDGGLLRSADGGQTWESLDTLPDELVPSCLLARGESLLLGSTSHGLLRSADGGQSWQPLCAGEVLSLAACGATLYAGTGAGLLCSADDGQTWKTLTPPVHDLRRLLVLGETLLVSGAFSGIFRADPSGGWRPLSGAPSPLVALTAAPGGLLVAAAADGIYHASAQTLIWTPVASAALGTHTCLSIGEHGAGYLLGANTALLRSADGGQTWEVLPSPLGVLLPIALQALPDQAVLAGSYDQRRGLAQPWRSRDGAASWERGAEIATPWPLAAAFARPPLLTLGETLHAERSDRSWQAAPLGSAGSAVRRVVGDKQALCALATDGLYRSSDGGQSWARWAEALPPREVLDIALGAGRFYALLVGGRVFWTS
jgi:photosystem II stability/assembly factor-like uncharacterized protein